MSITHTATRSYKDVGPSSITDADVIVGNNEDNLDDTVAATTNNHLFAWTCTRANLQSLLLYSDQAVTVYTNAPSTGSPQDTIPLAAGQTLIWVLATDLIARCPFSSNITGVYVTNAGSTIANFKIRALKNQ